MRYPTERKEAILKKMVPPNHRSIRQLAREEGVSEATLYQWRHEARLQGQLLPKGERSPPGWTSADKFAAVVESAALNEAELSAWCRERGLYPGQVREWRAACERANDWDRAQNRQLRDARQADAKRLRELERELARKERALAEAAALLVLQKKSRQIWAEGEAG